VFGGEFSHPWLVVKEHNQIRETPKMERFPVGVIKVNGNAVLDKSKKIAAGELLET
jgi:hypothetical protein